MAVEELLCLEVLQTDYTATLDRRPAHTHTHALEERHKDHIKAAGAVPAVTLAPTVCAHSHRSVHTHTDNMYTHSGVQTHVWREHCCLFWRGPLFSA